MPNEPTTMTTWQRADGETIEDHTWVTEPEWFDDLDEPIRLRRRRWVCVEDQTGTYNPPGAVILCPSCDGEGVYEDDGGECLRCRGIGEHDRDAWEPEAPTRIEVPGDR